MQSPSPGAKSLAGGSTSPGRVYANRSEQLLLFDHSACRYCAPHLISLSHLILKPRLSRPEVRVPPLPSSTVTPVTQQLGVLHHHDDG